MNALIDAGLWVAAPTILLLALVGLGDAFLPRDARLPIERAVASSLVGLLLLMAVVPLWNLFLPLGARTGALTVTVGVGLSVLRRRAAHLSLRILLGFLAAVVVIAALYRISSLLIPIRFLTDTVVYHLPHAEWIAQEPMPLGTGNIQTRLGLNPGFFTLTTALRFAPLGQTHLFVTEVAIRAIFLLVALSTFQTARERADRWMSAFALSTAMVSIPFFAINKSGTDGNVGFLLLTVALIATALYGSATAEQRSDGTVLLFALIGLAATFKLSSATAVLLLMPLMVGRARVPATAFVSRRSLPLMSLTSLAAVGWALKSFATTGCFVFPVAASCTAVPWGVGKTAADITAIHVTSFARRSDLSINQADLLDLSWVVAWLPTYLTSVPALVLLAVLPVAVIGWAQTSTTDKVVGRRRRLAWALIPLASAPAVLVALSVADLLGGRRFLGVDPAIVGVLADYPYPRVLVLTPLFAIGAMLLVVSALPLRRATLSDTASLRTCSRVAALLPYLLLTFVYWFLSAPAVRFAWAPHVLLSAILVTRWASSVDMERLSALIPLGTRNIGLLVAGAGILVAGIIQPVLPIFAPEVEEQSAVLVGPAALSFRVPPTVDECSTLFPCLPVPAQGVSARRSLGRLIISAEARDESRLLEELGIIPRR